MNRFLLGALTMGALLLLSSFALTRTPSIPRAATVPMGEFYKIARAQYVDTTPVGTNIRLTSQCFITNVSASTLQLGDVFVLGPGGITTVLGTYHGLLGVILQPGGQVRLQIDSATIPAISAETSLDGNGVKSVVVSWLGLEGAVDLSVTIDRIDNFNTYSRATASVVGVPVIL